MRFAVHRQGDVLVVIGCCQVLLLRLCFGICNRKRQDGRLLCALCLIREVLEGDVGVDRLAAVERDHADFDILCRGIADGIAGLLVNFYPDCIVIAVIGGKGGTVFLQLEPCGNVLLLVGECGFIIAALIAHAFEDVSAESLVIAAHSAHQVFLIGEGHEPSGLEGSIEVSGDLDRYSKVFILRDAYHHVLNGHGVPVRFTNIASLGGDGDGIFPVQPDVRRAFAHDAPKVLIEDKRFGRDRHRALRFDLGIQCGGCGDDCGARLHGGYLSAGDRCNRFIAGGPGQILDQGVFR